MKGDEGMREFKFRIWDMDRKVMLGSRYVIFYDGDFYENYRDLEDGILIENIAVMQYTGLKDKNGVEIYEGDIVKVISGYGWEDVSDVIFGLTDKRYGSYPAFCIPGVETESNSFSEVFDSGDYEIEVIGNIYENPELLESKKD